MKFLFVLLGLMIFALFALILWFAATAPGWVLIPLGIFVAAYTAKMIWDDLPQ